MEQREAFRFHTPSSLLVVGPSGCVRTVFTTKRLLNNLDLFHAPPSQIHYCYGVWQEGFQPMKERGNKFHEGVPDKDQLKTWFLKSDYLCWTIYWLREGTINGCWICSPNSPIIRTSPCSMEVVYKNLKENQPNNGRDNIFIAAVNTCWARLKLYSRAATTTGPVLRH